MIGQTQNFDKKSNIDKSRYVNVNLNVNNRYGKY
jgi:hypothetical protein